MPKNCVEYGSIDYNTDDTNNTYTERSIISCLMASLGMTSICTGSTWEGIFILGAVPMMWFKELSSYLEQCYPLAYSEDDDDDDDDSGSESDSAGQLGESGVYHKKASQEPRIDEDVAEFKYMTDYKEE